MLDFLDLLESLRTVKPASGNALRTAGTGSFGGADFREKEEKDRK
jgi:hypothetical protein